MRFVSNKLVNFSIFCSVLIILLVIAELVLTAYFPIHSADHIDAYRYDAQLGYVLKKDLHYGHTSDYYQEHISNALGSVNWQNNFADYEQLVFAVGDSYTQGIGLPSDSAYPFQLDLLLNMDNSGHYVKKYAVLNLGVAGFGGKQALLRLQTYIDKIGKPDYILYLSSANDHADDQRFEQGKRHQHLVDDNPEWGVLLTPLQWLRHKTQIGQRLKLAWTQLKNTATEARTQNHPAITVAQLQQHNYQQLKQLAQTLGAKLIISWSEWPNPDSPSDSYRWLQQWAQQEGVAFAHWLPSVQSVMDNISSLSALNPHSGRHLRAWVNGFIARSYAHQISARF